RFYCTSGFEYWPLHSCHSEQSDESAVECKRSLEPVCPSQMTRAVLILRDQLKLSSTLKSCHSESALAVRNLLFDGFLFWEWLAATQLLSSLIIRLSLIDSVPTGNCPG